MSAGGVALPRSASLAHHSAWDQENSPGQFHFRPPFPLTFAFRLLPLDSVSTYSRSVPGAKGNLTVCPSGSRGRKKNVAAICEVFLFQHFHSDSSNLWR